MRVKKIAFVSDAVLPFHKGGKETRIFHLTRGLMALGFDVHIYTMQWWQGSKTYIDDGITYHAISRFHPLYTKGRRSISEGLLFGLACFKLLRADFDILEVDHIPYFPLYASKVVSILRRRPLYATWHEVWGGTYWRQYLGRIGGTLASVVERTSVALPNHIIAVSPRTRADITKVLHYHGALSLIPNGIDAAAISRIAPSQTASDVIFVGRLMPHKHVDHLIQAIARVKPLQHDIHCLIIGDGPERPHLRQLIAELDLDHNVELAGYIESSQEVFARMKASKIFALPSTREGFGITVLEAFACGLRVVTVEHPDNAAQDLVTPDRGLVCAPDPASLAKALEKLLGEPADGSVPAIVADYSWDTHVADLSEVYAL